jgi:hypothetical protein
MTASTSSSSSFLSSRGVLWDTNDPDYVGYLMKKSRWMGEWRRRFFILKGSKMFFSKDEYSKPHGMIDLVDCIRVSKGTEEINSRIFSFEIVLRDKTQQTKGGAVERFILSADSKEEQRKVMIFLAKSLERHSSVVEFCGDME